MIIQFSKYQGTGNDFIIIDNRKSNFKLTSDQVKSMCDRKFGIGADGLMLMEESLGYDFNMIYYNSDGNLSSMCGNGGRCIVAFAKQNGIHKNKFYFLAADGAHQAEIVHKAVHLKMQDVHKITRKQEGYELNTGSPHLVFFVQNISEIDVVGQGRRIRNSAPYKEHGININFVEEKNGLLYVRTYERGVEDETLSCGTGVTASVIAFHEKSQTIFSEKNVLTRGGLVNVSFQKIEEIYKEICLSGPAEHVFSGKIEIS